MDGVNVIVLGYVVPFDKYLEIQDSVTVKLSAVLPTLIKSWSNHSVRASAHLWIGNPQMLLILFFLIKIKSICSQNRHEPIHETLAVHTAVQGLKNLFLLSHISKKRVVLHRPLAQHCRSKDDQIWLFLLITTVHFPTLQPVVFKILF